MASQEQVRNFLAHWFQLGKPVVLADQKGECLPDPIFCEGAYSQSFEDCWHRIMMTSGQDCYLQGTTQSIAAMLSPAWEMIPCARCDMPLAIPIAGPMNYLCPCNDLRSWPNTDIPTPRTAISNDDHLRELRQRLGQVQGQPSTQPRPTYAEEETSTFPSWRGIS